MILYDSLPMLGKIGEIYSDWKLIQTVTKEKDGATHPMGTRRNFDILIKNARGGLNCIGQLQTGNMGFQLGYN